MSAGLHHEAGEEEEGALTHTRRPHRCSRRGSSFTFQAGPIISPLSRGQMRLCRGGCLPSPPEMQSPRSSGPQSGSWAVQPSVRGLPHSSGPPAEDRALERERAPRRSPGVTGCPLAQTVPTHSVAPRITWWDLTPLSVTLYNVRTLATCTCNSLRKKRAGAQGLLPQEASAAPVPAPRLPRDHLQGISENSTQEQIWGCSR